MKRRETEALRLYEPLEHLVGFHASRAPERVIRAGNRAGKTITGCVELARCVTGQDPYDKYPKENGSAIIVGADGRHLADPLFKLLFHPGALRTVKEHGRHVLYKPWIHGEKVRTYPAAPLIPPRFIKHHFWLSKKGNIPKMTLLKNGWEIKWFSSEGKPPQGIRVHYAHFDEEIVDPTWYMEVAARLVDYRGYFVWTATAQKGGLQFYELCEEADRQKQFHNPRVIEYTSHIKQNPYFTNEQRELFFGKLTEEERRIRVEGEFAFTSYKVYPEYDDHQHLVPPFEIPSDWMRVMTVDPGRQVCAVLFAAVPPPTHKDPGAIYFYDELYLQKCSAQMFGDEVRKRIHQQPFDTFLIDPHGGRLRDIGSGESVEMQYSQALKERGITCRRTGARFLWGSDDILGGIEKFRSWLLPRQENATPKLRVVFGRCPKFAWEIKRYHYKRDRNGTIKSDEPDQRNNHLMDTARYLAMFDPQYRAPKLRSRSANIAAYVKKKITKRKRQDALSNEDLTWKG